MTTVDPGDRTADWKGEVGSGTPMVENRINCGLGKRGRCSIGRVCVCKHGPVFTAAQMKALPAEYRGPTSPEWRGGCVAPGRPMSPYLFLLTG